MHDYLYRLISVADPNSLHIHLPEAGLADWWELNSDLKSLYRKWADEQFYLAMRACGTSPWLASAMFIAVRWFGAAAIERAENQ